MKWGKKDTSVIPPTSFCTKCSADTKIINFALGTQPNNPSSIINTAFSVNPNTTPYAMLYLYGIPATNNAVYVNNVVPEIEISDPTLATVTWVDGEGLKIEPHLAGTATVRVSYTYNAGIETAVMGVPSATGEGQIIMPEYTASATIQIRVTGNAPGPGPGDDPGGDDPGGEDPGNSEGGGGSTGDTPGEGGEG